MRLTRPLRLLLALGDAFLREAVATANAEGVTLQARPFVFNAESLRKLIDMGSHWFVADAPQALREAIDAGLKPEMP